ncbi:hypothetical protein AQUCO_00600261v1 [Aquilegia coerulea]|uniref:Uncharacterized protein n=1 Tax=Aquilegia coerulea TaxID=218851 RepID=A0A2G5ENR1_AQUCA|nr:hypothetical protein AQUCO_00600261v1 [Aquilegia coerulea]
MYLFLHFFQLNLNKYTENWILVLDLLKLHVQTLDSGFGFCGEELSLKNIYTLFKQFSNHRLVQYVCWYFPAKALLLASTLHLNS